MKNANVVTPFVREERRMMAAFAAEMKGFDLEADSNCFGGHYVRDTESGENVFMLAMSTKPFPLAGNSDKVRDLNEAGYCTDVYVPYGWNRRRGVRVMVCRPVIVKEGGSA